MNNNYTARNICDFIPHRPPMVLIDRIEQYRADFLIASVEISEQTPFVDSASRHVPNYVGIEYMAQTVAALAGIEAEQRGEPIRTGFLLGTRKLSFSQAGYNLGQRYHISVQRLYQEDSGLAVFDCSIHDAQQQLIASANVNVFQPQQTDAYLAGELSL
ncbi:hotdog family protein [Shewanella avicenniae]|uniref:Hotdog family protein n=1 Tax=Shewanella avicenniae TaxID=2814294 RepID=A0ABX7QR27_9GAMM|nr:hotdog family protein [Shewanella avicenniae]QSX33918.1 hotdog family protein [Shewanella avicenniae]